jgi:hypothetical protein
MLRSFIHRHEVAMVPDILETPNEVAARIRRPASWLAKLRVTGGGPLFLKVGGKVLYRRRDVDAWLAACERANTAQPQRMA